MMNSRIENLKKKKEIMKLIGCLRENGDVR